MNKLSRKSMIGAFALLASLSAPLAFAQDAATTEQVPTEQAEVTDAAAPAAAPEKKSWADVDADQDGSLSKTEAATVPALESVFDQADGNADGSLTADEYKTYVAQVQGGAAGNGDGGTP